MQAANAAIENGKVGSAFSAAVEQGKVESRIEDEVDGKEDKKEKEGKQDRMKKEDSAERKERTQDKSEKVNKDVQLDDIMIMLISYNHHTIYKGSEWMKMRIAKS